MSKTLQLPQNRFYTTDIRIKFNNNYYQLSSGEKLIFGVKASSLNSEYLIKKEMTSNHFHSETNGYTLTLTTADTNIEIGDYFYDVALLRADGELVPIIKCTPLQISDSIVRSDE